MVDYEIVAETSARAGRDYQLPAFDVHRIDPTRGRVFWMFLWFGDEVVGGAACQLQDLGEEPLSQYLQRVADHQVPVREGRTLDRVSPLLKAVKGRVAYCGELHIASKHRG